MTEYKRRCENWLHDFGDWAVPVSEAPESFIMWTGLYNLAAALRRHVWIPKRDSKTGRMLLGSWSVYPNLYILFVAKAGKARKSTTVNYTEHFVAQVPEITRSPEMVTKERLMSRLSKAPDTSMYIVAPEFGEFIVKSGTDMFGFLTNAYDGKARLDVETHIRGSELAENPCVNLIGATTPEWIADNMPESVIGGGFASRVIFVFEKKKRRSALFYDEVDGDKIMELQKNLLADIVHIATSLHGEVSFTKDAQEFTHDWYQAQDKLADDIPDKLSGYFERKPAHVLKTALLVHFARTDSMVLERVDVETAIGLVEQVERNLGEVFQGIGKNKYVLDIKNILEFIITRKRVAERDIFRAYYHSGLPQEIRAMIESLLEAGLVQLEIATTGPENQRRFYVPATALVDSLQRVESNGDHPPMLVPRPQVNP